MDPNANTSLIETFPIDFDFTDHYGETWEILIDTCDSCSICQGIGFIHNGSGVEVVCDSCEGLGGIENESYFPLAKIIKAYPLPPKYKPNDNIKKCLINTTIVSIAGNAYLVPISTNYPQQQWDICETYVRLGFFPPASVVLPKHKNRGESRSDKILLEQLEESVRRAIAILKDRLELMQMLPVVEKHYKPVMPVMPSYRRKKKTTNNLPVPEWLDDDDE